MEGSDMLKYALILFLALVLVFIFMKLYNDQPAKVVVEKKKPTQNINVKLQNELKREEPRELEEPRGLEEEEEEVEAVEGYENGNGQSAVMGFSDNGDFGDVLAPVPRSENSPEVSFKTCDLNKVSPEELLPSSNTEFTKLNPSVPNSLENKNFLEAGAHIGLDTVGQSLRNASHDLRAEPPNPQTNVSPWLNTTIQPDPTRRPLC